MGFGHGHSHGPGHNHDRGEVHDRSAVNTLKRFQVLLKTSTYAIMHMGVAIAVAYVLSGSWEIALAIGTVEPIVQTVFFFFHERFWHKFGSRRQAHTHNAVTDSTNPLPKVAHPKAD